MSESMTSDLETPDAADTGATAMKGAGVRKGGLLVAPKLHMTPVLTVFMTVLYIDVVALLVVPFLLTTGTDSPWQFGPRLAFLGQAVATGLVFGLLASVIAERRNHTAWWFLAGQVGTFLAPLLALADWDQGFAPRLVVMLSSLVGTVLCMTIVQAFAREHPREWSAPTRATSRFWHACGNIWFGIGLLVLLTSAVAYGPFWENDYGAKSAQHVIYTSWWFGLIFLGFSASLIAATLRKYPFRLDQTGWLVIHLALVTIIVGSFFTFWGKVDGEMSLKEGESADWFRVTTQTRIKVDALTRGATGSSTWEPIWETISDVDLDPSTKEFSRPYTVERDGKKLFDFVCDRYYADVDIDVHRFDDGPKRRAAIFAKVPGMRAGRIQLVEGGDRRRESTTLGGMLGMRLVRVPSPLVVESLKGGRDLEGHGQLVVRDANGDDLLTVAVNPGPRPDGEPTAPADLSALDIPIPGTEVRLQGVSWYSSFALVRRDQPPVDRAPGVSGNPAATVKLTGPDGDERRTAFAFMPELSTDEHALKKYADVRVFLDYIPRFPIGGGLWFIVHEDEAPFWAMDFADGQRRTGPVTPGGPLDLGIPLQIEIEEVYARLREEEEVLFSAYEPGTQFLRFDVRDGSPDGRPECWVALGHASRRFQRDGKWYRIRWEQTRRKLGFNLHLRDFRRDFYPGSDQASTFESYLWLTHPTKHRERAGIKIDMNHPLRLDGWRLYQSRFSMGGGVFTHLQVNRDPGLVLIYPACAVLVLGLLIVFFQKPFLRAWKRWLEQRDVPAHIHFLAALGKIGMSLGATIPGIAVILIFPEGPLQGLGVFLIIGGLVLETAWVNVALTRRLKQSAAPSSKMPPTGASS